MLDFYRSQGGRRFIDSTVPELVRQLKRIADALEAAQAPAPYPGGACGACGGAVLGAHKPGCPAAG